MSLRDLVVGLEAHDEPGLSSLVTRPVVSTAVELTPERPNLPRMMNQLQRGEIVEPPSGEGLAGMVNEPISRPTPAERPVDWSKWKTELAKIKAEIAVESAIDHAELRHRIATRKGCSLEAAEQWMEAQNAG
jgi:hypothetical protein